MSVAFNGIAISKVSCIVSTHTHRVLAIKLTSTIFVIHIQQIARTTGAVKTTTNVITDVLTSTIVISTFIDIYDR